MTRRAKLSVLAGLGALALVPPAGSSPAVVAPPTQPGPWRQLGAAVTSKPGALAAVSRQQLDPRGLAVVAVSSSARRMRVTWWSYCEFQSDDGETETNSGVLTGTRRVTKYLSIMENSTLCQVAVSARISGKPKVRTTVAAFGY